MPLGEGFTALQEGGVGALLSWGAAGEVTSDHWQLNADDSGQLPERLLDRRVETSF